MNQNYVKEKIKFLMPNLLFPKETLKFACESANQRSSRIYEFFNLFLFSSSIETLNWKCLATKSRSRDEHTFHECFCKCKKKLRPYKLST